MHASTQQRILPVRLSTAVWLPVFLSPTAFCLLLAAWNRSQLPTPPQGIIVSLFCLLPLAALLVCGGAVWRSRLRWGLKISGLLITVVAMVLQVAVLLWLIVAMVTVAIALPQ